MNEKWVSWDAMFWASPGLGAHKMLPAFCLQAFHDKDDDFMSHVYTLHIPACCMIQHPYGREG